MERVLMRAVRLHALLLAGLLAGCGGADATGTASSGDVAITATPSADVHRGANNFTLKLAVGATPLGASQHTVVTVSPWMPAMGHGAPYDPTVTDKGSGTFSVDDAEFEMPGTWELRVKVTSDIGSGSSSFKYDVP
jgi:hypothetical protein